MPMPWMCASARASWYIYSFTLKIGILSFRLCIVCEGEKMISQYEKIIHVKTDLSQYLLKYFEIE